MSASGDRRCEDELLICQGEGGKSHNKRVKSYINIFSVRKVFEEIERRGEIR